MDAIDDRHEERNVTDERQILIKGWRAGIPLGINTRGPFDLNRTDEKRSAGLILTGEAHIAGAGEHAYVKVRRLRQQVSRHLHRVTFGHHVPDCPIPHRVSRVM